MSWVDNFMDMFSKKVYSVYSIFYAVLAFVHLMRGSTGRALLFGVSGFVWSLLMLWAIRRKRRLDAWDALEELGE